MTELISLLILLFLSGIFSGSETALVSLSMARVEGLVSEGRRGAAALYRFKKDPSRMLTTILIGNNLVNIAASALATVIATRWFGSIGPGIAVGVLTVLILVFGEITPKSLATRHAESISLFIAPFMLAFMRLIYPLVWMFGHLIAWVHKTSGKKGDPVVTESELINMLGYGVKEGTIGHDERQLIERVFTLNRLKARDVMTPQGSIFSLEGSQTVADALPKVTHATYSRIPLYQERADNIYKVLYMRDLLEPVASGRLDVRLDTIAHDPLFVTQYQAIDELFDTLRRSNRHLAIVVDEFGTVRGIVTFEDLMEELVGEIYDESDLTPTDIRKISENEIIADCTSELRVVEEFFGVDLPGKPTDTISLWVLSHTEYIPSEDEAFKIDELEVKILKATSRSIISVRIRRPPADQVSGSETGSDDV